VKAYIVILQKRITISLFFSYTTTSHSKSGWWIPQKKTTKWVCENYSTIFLPKFETQRMVSKRQRKINSKTARKMLAWSHYRFKTQLMNKAREYSNCRLIICGEEYTSQTCSECGYLHRKIGGSKKFKCSGCNQESDRDFNAARNILLKNMSLVFRD
jgi:putative transposase